MNKQHDSSKKPASSDRREFLRRGLMATSLVLVSPSVLLAGGAPSGACELTHTDYYGLGPYYRQGAPIRQILAPAGEPGQRLFITGVVYANDCTTPLKNVEVDVWHADDNGCYNPFQQCAIPTGGDEYKLRGKIYTSEAGVFAFESVKPGRYLNGAQYRPSHVHFKFIHPAIPELVTQLYFEGDPYIPVDAAASRADAASRIIPLTQDASGMHGLFDVILDVSPEIASADNPYNNAGYDLLRQNHPNPVGATTTIPFLLARRSHVEIAIFDMRGNRVRRLLDGTRAAGVNTIEWDGNDDRGQRLPTGAYHYRMTVDGRVQAKKMLVE
jgi:protocatechuate 3,4-dioxygenase beta subunit